MSARENDLAATLRCIVPALRVLETMCTVAGLRIGARRAAELIGLVELALWKAGV